MDFESLLEYETNATELLTYKCCNNQMLLWPIVRYTVHQESLNRLNSFENPHAKIKINGLLKTAKWVLLTLFKNPYLSKRKNIAIFTSNVLNMLENGKYYNRLHEQLINTYPEDVILLESSFKFEYRAPRASKVYYPDIFTVFIKIMSYFYHVSEQDFLIIEEFISYLKKTYPINFDDEFYKNLHGTLLNVCKKWNPIKIIYLGFSRFKKIQTVIIDCASYGSIFAVIMYHLNKNGIKTIELQHGLVACNHVAYNYPPSICKKENDYHFYLPQYYATFGQYWSDNIRIASEKYVIGFPYLLKKASFICKTLKPSVLVISDGTLPQINLDVCNALVNKFGNKYDILLKLHPGEVPLLSERYGSLLKLQSIKLKTYESVYDFLSSAHYVVGCGSTVMVEALAFGIIPFVYKTDYTDQLFNKIPFNYFTSMLELVDNIEASKNVKLDTSYYWADNSSSRLQTFFEEIGVL